MTPDEARERFSEAHEGSLKRGEQHAFEELLERDAALRLDYERFCEVVRAAAELSSDTDDESVDLLPGLQERLRAQSGGRFYRDRFAQQKPTRSVAVLAASVCVLLFAVLWFAFQAGLL